MLRSQYFSVAVREIREEGGSGGSSGTLVSDMFFDTNNGKICAIFKIASVTYNEM
jgi:hypothetical protein